MPKPGECDIPNADVLHIAWKTDFICGNDSEEGRYMETVAGDEGCWPGGLDLYIWSKSMWTRNEVYVGGGGGRYSGLKSEISGG
jgi:hypothetical protein